MKVKTLVQTCEVCPSQWSGETTTGEEIYIRYRYGNLSVQLGGPGGEFLFDETIGDQLDGFLLEEDMIELVEYFTDLDFSEVKNAKN